eukprot:jgi/Tetstr1/463714/TSEL_008573.t1
MPLVAVAAVEAAEAQAAVSVEVMAVDAAMEAHTEADEDRAGTLDLEAMFSRILEKSQAAHGATGAMRLAVEVPDPFLDGVDTDDHGTLLHGASCVELPVRELREVFFGAPGLEQEAPASYEGRRGGGAITADMLDIRNQQLLQHMRTALQHAKFPGLPVAVSVYGLSLPRVSVPPLSLPAAEPQANIHPVDVVQHGVKPLESRRQLSATSSELQQLRDVQRSAYPDYPEYDRHSAFYVDCKLTVIVIGGVRILMALLYTGCDYSGVLRRVVDRMKPGEADATLHSMSMQGIGGKMEMQRLVGRISYVINPDTDWERKFEWPSFAILEGDHLPDVIFRIELQPDNVGTDAAVQPEQQADDAELPELVADSDDEEDFVPCWVEEVPDHVANVNASCFTLRASPMDADCDSDEELPDMMEDYSDDDDVYVELIIMTQMEPEVETTHYSEPSAAGACYAMRAESLSADNLQEPDCPSDDEELKEGTAMPLRGHADEIPDWRELRRQRQAAGWLHLSGHTLERLALVRAVPHSTPELTYIIDLDRTGGKEGRAKQGLFLFAGMLSVLFTNLVDGYHYELIQIVDRMLRSVAHRQRLLRQLEWMHQRWPMQLPRNAFEKCFALSDELEHDVEHITAPAILRHLPELDELRAEPPCQDVSSMGTQHGLHGARTGVIVPLAEAMSELNCMLAKARGVKEYWAAFAQYGYVIEIVIPAAPSRRSPEVQEFIDFMTRVFGEPNAHHAHKCGDASLRSALWWTNTFTQHYYQAVQHEFERPPRETYAQIVERCNGGLLRAQVATPTRPGTMLGGLNVAGRRMIYAPKSVSTPNTRTQRLRPGGAPGSGMVEVVGIDPPQYRPSSAVMREACLLDRDYAGFYTRQELGFSEEEMVIAIGNVCAPTSVSVMNRCAVAYAHERRHQQMLQAVCAATIEEDAPADAAVEDHSVKSQELRAAQHELRRSTAAAVEAEIEHAINMATLKQGTRVKPPDNPRTAARVTKAGRRWLEEQRQATRATEREVAKARRRVLAVDHTARVVAGDHKAAKPRPRRGRAATGRKTVSAALTLLMWLALLGPACFVAAGVGSRAGAGLMADVFGGAQERPAWATSHVNGADDKAAADGWSRRNQAALVKCYAAYANEKHLGKESPTVKVTSKLINPKDSKQPHHWAISEDWKDKEGFAALMDSDSEWYAWGLDDLRAVDAEPYDFQLVDYNPVFKRKYHLAHREQEWANDWVKKL